MYQDKSNIFIVRFNSELELQNRFILFTLVSGDKNKKNDIKHIQFLKHKLQVTKECIRSV